MIDDLYGSRCSCCDGGVSDSSVSVGVGIDDDLLDEILQEIYNEEVDEVSGISPTLFSANRDYFHKAIDDGIITSANAKIDADQEWIDALKHSADVFSLHRTANQCALLAESMVDSDGNLKSFDQFKKDTQSINKHYNQAWLRTEYDTAVLRAQMGADWKLFERDADVLPNLRWMQTTSANPREAHAVFWRNKLTLPIDDPFWSKHRPGDQWNCKCWLEQTDEDATKKEDMPSSSDMPEPKAGLKGNPAKTKEIFSQDHPHFPNACATCHLNTDGKVHGVKGDKDAKNAKRLKGNCNNCIMMNSCKKRVEKCESYGYRKDDEFGERLLIHSKCDENDKTENIIAARSLLVSFNDMVVKIRKHIIAKGVKNPEYEIDGVLADRKSIKDTKGISTAFKAAKEQNCKAVVIDFDAEITRKGRKLKFNSIAREIENRSADLASGFQCYLIYGGRAAKVSTDFLEFEKDSIRKNKILLNLVKQFNRLGVEISYELFPY